MLIIFYFEPYIKNYFKKYKIKNYVKNARGFFIPFTKKIIINLSSEIWKKNENNPFLIDEIIRTINHETLHYALNIIGLRFEKKQEEKIVEYLSEQSFNLFER